MKAVVLSVAAIATGLVFVSARASNSLTPVAPTQAPQSLETCFSPEEKCDVRLIAFIDSATRTLDVTLYNLTHKGILKAIEDARARGVVVRIVADKGQAEFKNTLIVQLRDDGLVVKFGTQNGPYSLMHDKFSIVDGQIVETGSFNYTVAATKNNHENQLYISAPEVVSRYQTAFERMYAEGEMMPEGFKNDKGFNDCSPSPSPSPIVMPSPKPL